MGAVPLVEQMANCLPSELQTRVPGEEHVLPEEEPPEVFVDDESVAGAVAGAAAGEAATEGAAAAAGEGATEGAAAAGEAAGEGATEGAAAEAPPADEPPLGEAA